VHIVIAVFSYLRVVTSDRTEEKIKGDQTNMYLLVGREKVYFFSILH
jgi:hypothetical protein